jgi:hypothetical protein
MCYFLKVHCPQNKALETIVDVTIDITHNYILTFLELGLSNY